mgnify:FL=1
MQRPTTIIGWQEWISLPELGLQAIKVKVDTGAKTSSLHAEEIEDFKKNGEKWVRFKVFPIQNNKDIVRICEAPLVDQRHVKSSSGNKEQRPVIRTIINIGGRKWQADVNLTNRDYMGFRMLLGREAIASRIIVDPGSKFMHGIIKSLKAIDKYK